MKGQRTISLFKYIYHFIVMYHIILQNGIIVNHVHSQYDWRHLWDVYICMQYKSWYYTYIELLYTYIFPSSVVECLKTNIFSYYSTCMLIVANFEDVTQRLLQELVNHGGLHLVPTTSRASSIYRVGTRLITELRTYI